MTDQPLLQMTGDIFGRITISVDKSNAFQMPFFFIKFDFYLFLYSSLQIEKQSYIKRVFLKVVKTLFLLQSLFSSQWKEKMTNEAEPRVLQE